MSLLSHGGISFQPIYLQNTNTKYLKLKNKNIGEDDAKLLDEALKNIQNTCLCLRGNSIQNEGTRYLAEALKNTHIEDLFLDDNEISDDGVKDLAQALESTKIKYLNLNENHIGIDGAQYIRDVLDKTKISSLHMQIHLTKNYGTQYISYDSYNNAKKINITFESNKIGANGAKYINETFQITPIFRLKLAPETLEADDVQYLAEAFKNVKITNLDFIPIMETNSIQFLIQIFKNSKIAKLNLYNQELKFTGAENLALFLKEVKIIDLDICNTKMGDKCIEHLVPSLNNNTILNLDLSWNYISDEGLKYVAEVLKNSHITRLNLLNNRFKDRGARYLANSLVHSQLRSINLSRNMIGIFGHQYLQDVIDYTFVTDIILHCKSAQKLMELNQQDIHIYTKRRSTFSFVAEKLITIFKSIFNPMNNQFRFTINKNDSNPTERMNEYIFLIKILKDVPMLKVHIIDEICRKEKDDFDLILMEKINEFIISASDMFNTFFNDEVQFLMELVPDFDYVNLVKRFEDYKLYDIVINLLLHRELYYVDKNQEILHPYINQMLHKYNMALYNEQLEHGEREKIISYYQDDSKIDDTQKIIDLLKSVSFKMKTDIEYLDFFSG